MLSNRPRGSRDSREIDPIEENLSQGISRQPAQLRFPGQLADATNTAHSVVDGTSKRPGTHFERAIGSPASIPLGNYRMHPIDRDASERYIVRFGEGSIRIFDTINGDEATVTLGTDVAKYLWGAGATADHLRFLTSADTTLILNTLIPASSMRSPSYSVTSTVRDYDVLRAITPADETYHATTEDVTDFPEGYYYYDVGGVTFAKVQFPAVSGDGNAWEQGYYNDAALPFGDVTPLQFRIHFQKGPLTFVDGAFTTATKRLVKAGAFTLASAGDWIKVTAGTGVTPDWYEIAFKISADEVELSLDIGGANPADVAATSIASRHDVVYTVDAGAGLADMHAVAAKWQSAMESTGAVGALCSWTETGYQQGYFTITSPYRGSGTTILDIGPTGSGADVSDGNYMFTAAGASITAGSGSGSLTLDVDDRWTSVPAPNQADAQIDPNTMPVAMARTKKGPGSTFSIDLVDWNDRTSGDEDSNPSPKPLSEALTGTITSITSAANGVVTTAGHGLVTGDQIFIHSTNSNALLDGFRTVTRINDDTFTVGVNTTGGAGTTGRWSRGAKPIADMLFVEKRLALAIDDRFITSQTDDIYNFYIANAADVVDTDPIDIPIGSDDVSIIASMVESQKTIVIHTTSGQQFEMAEAEAMTPTSVRFTQTTRHVGQDPSYGTRPKSLASVLYFMGKSERSAPLWEYRRDDLQAISTATDVSKHVEGFLPSEIRTFITAPSANQVYALEENDRGLYVYQAHWSGVKKEQSAWTRWQFDGNYRIADIVFLADRVYMLVETAPPATVSVASPGVITLNNHGFSTSDTVAIFDSDTTPTLDGTRTVTKITDHTFSVGVNVTAIPAGASSGSCRVCSGAFVLEDVTTSREQVKPAALSLSAWPYAIHMDRQIVTTGVYDPTPGNEWTEFPLPTGFNGLGSTLNRVVLGPAFGALAGDALSISAYGSNYVRVTGDYDAGEVVIGRFYTMQAEPTRPFMRDERGRADRLVGLVVKRCLVGYEDSGSFSVIVSYEQPGPATSTTTFTPTAATETGTLDVPVYSNASKCTITISSATPEPVIITGIQWIADYAEGLR